VSEDNMADNKVTDNTNLPSPHEDDSSSHQASPPVQTQALEQPHPSPPLDVEEASNEMEEEQQASSHEEAVNTAVVPDTAVPCTPVAFLQVVPEVSVTVCATLVTLTCTVISPAMPAAGKLINARFIGPLVATC
jgi:hypothetical protein